MNLRKHYDELGKDLTNILAYADIIQINIDVTMEHLDGKKPETVKAVKAIAFDDLVDTLTKMGLYIRKDKE